MLDAHGADDLEAAIVTALQSPAPNLGTVRQLLDLQQHRRAQPPPLPLTLPDDPRVRELSVRPHALETYQQLLGVPRDDDDPND